MVVQKQTVVSIVVLSKCVAFIAQHLVDKLSVAVLEIACAIDVRARRAWRAEPLN